VGRRVTGSTIIPASERLTLSTSVAWASSERLRWMMPSPPSRARAMARRASVTVSIGEERMGMARWIRRVSTERVLTSWGETSLCPGTSSTSSKVRASPANLTRGRRRSTSATGWGGADGWGASGAAGAGGTDRAGPAGAGAVASPAPPRCVGRTSLSICASSFTTCPRGSGGGDGAAPPARPSPPTPGRPRGPTRNTWLRVLRSQLSRDSSEHAKGRATVCPYGDNV
jgi:hypothetical protein